MTQKEPAIKYYFCRDTEKRMNIPTFYITPKEFFDAKGFLLDTSSFDPKVPGFQRLSDSTFEFVDLYNNPEEVLLKHGEFMWRDMLTEIKYTYRRRRLLGIEPMC